ncbi:acyltransferase family protein [Arthrobacter sp. Br18]|uniref:acyltransferase family protein n=1 Tax=Arthrobacter sp. Br18 TaxID=1312954 RepID=UPI00068526C5|nr:acyltransferase family protein [Arthrobacter sp. Br18]
MATLYAPAPAPAPVSAEARSGAIDALRIFAVVGIVTGHVWAGPVTDAGLYTWHVPAFFLLSGYLWKIQKPDARRAVAAEAKKRFRTIMTPYCAWLVVTLLVHVTIHDHRGTLTPPAVILPLIGGSLNAGPFGAYWFMPALFISAIMFRALERVPLVLRLSIIAGIAVVTYLFGEDLALLPMSLGVAGSALIFMLAGQGLQHFRTRVKRPVRFGSVCLIAGAAPILLGVSASLDMKYGELGTPVLSAVAAVMISSGLLLILEGVFSRLPIRVHTISTRLAVGCLMVVLTHTYVLWLLPVPDTERSFWVLIAAVVLPWAVALVLNRTPLSQIFLGTPRAT